MGFEVLRDHAQGARLFEISFSVFVLGEPLSGKIGNIDQLPTVLGFQRSDLELFDACPDTSFLGGRIDREPDALPAGKVCLPRHPDVAPIVGDQVIDLAHQNPFRNCWNLGKLISTTEPIALSVISSWRWACSASDLASLAFRSSNRHQTDEKSWAPA